MQNYPAAPAAPAGGSEHAHRIRILKRGLARVDSISAHYNPLATAVLQRLAAEVISGDYCEAQS